MSIPWNNIIDSKHGVEAFIRNESPHKTYDQSKNKFGSCFELATGSSLFDIWYGASPSAPETSLEYTGMPASTTPERLTFVSTSNDDTLLGSGAQIIKFEYLATHESEVYQIGEIELSGTSLVTSTETVYRMARAWITQGARNVGTITIRHETTTANIFAVLSPLKGQTQIAAYTIPANRSAIVTELHINLIRHNGSNNGAAEVALFIREFGTNVWRSTFARTISTAFGLNKTPTAGIYIPAKADVKAGGSYISDGASDFSADFDITLLK